MDEKKGKSRVNKLSNCMWCDFFNNKKCDLSVEIKIIKEEKMFAKAETTHKTYVPVDFKICIEKRKQFNKELKRSKDEKEKVL